MATDETASLTGTLRCRPTATDHTPSVQRLPARAVCSDGRSPRDPLDTVLLPMSSARLSQQIGVELLSYRQQDENGNEERVQQSRPAGTDRQPSPAPVPDSGPAEDADRAEQNHDAKRVVLP